MELAGEFQRVGLSATVGSPEEVAQSAAQMVRENLPGGRYIFDTGEGVMCDSPAANVTAMLDAVKRVARQGAPS